METKKFTRRRALAAAIGSLLTCPAIYAAEYEVSDLGTLGGGRFSLGLGVNDSGEATGLAHGADHLFHSAFLGQANTLPQPLDVLLGGSYSQGQDINNFHQVTGLAYVVGDGAYHAFLWQSASGALDLGTLEALPTTGNSQGLSINDLGQVAGASTVRNAAAQHAAVWTPVGGDWTIEDLGTLAADGGGDSRANAINDSGVAAGFATLPGTRAQRAVVWSKASGKWVAKDLGSLGGTYAAAAAINNSGLVAGSSSTALDAQVHAFVTDSTKTPAVLTDLKTLGGSYSEARAVNAAGDVVGDSITAGDQQQTAFLWQNATGMRNLNTLIDAGSGWTLQEARAISDAGYITGIGVKNGEKHAYLLTRLISDTTPPTVSFQLSPAAANGLAGWYLTPVTVAWSVGDPESAITSPPCPTGPITDTAGQPLGCTATNSAGLTTTVNTPVIKVDTTKPTFAGVPASFSQAATTTAGAVVSYTAPTAADTISGPAAPAVQCAPASGTTFAMGLTTVRCSATDTAGNVGNTEFTVAVSDQTPPDIVPNVSGPAGLNGWFIGAVTVSWNVGDAQSAVTSPACSTPLVTANGAGQTFSCTATSAGGTATQSTPPINIDTQGPAFANVPGSLTVAATSASGAVVTYTNPTAADTLSGLGQGVSCSPASGSTFPVGTTNVACAASDLAGNTSGVGFAVTVTSSSPPPPPPASEILGVAKAQCKRINATSGEWLVQGTSTISTNNSIQLFATSSPGSSLLGAPVPVSSKGTWQYQAKPGPACTSPISAKSSATGTVRSNIAVNLQ